MFYHKRFDESLNIVSEPLISAKYDLNEQRCIVFKIEIS